MYDDAGAMPLQAPLPTQAESTAARQAGFVASETVMAEEASARDCVPSESEILAGLVKNLGQCPGCSMSLAEIRDRLPTSLRRLAEDTDGICKWLLSFPGLFEVSGPPGGEQITLTVGKLPRLAVSVEAGPGSTSGSLSGAAEVSQESSVAAVGKTNSADDCAGLALEAGIEEESLSPSTVQLRGLPFRATIADIKAFLGEHASHLVTVEPAIRLLLNRDGRPSGFARVQFMTPHAAQACRESLHRQLMGDRYVEVLNCSDRTGKVRHRRAEVGTELGAAAPGDGVSEYLERERVLQECQEHMRMPGRNQLLLSMLGIALSPPARAYLRRANLGLKHFLARFPNEFHVEGPKGCERVIWCGTGSLSLMSGADTGVVLNAAAGSLADAPGVWSAALPQKEPSTPKLMPSPNKASVSHSGHCVATPSDWGTPGPLPSQQPTTEASTASVMDFSFPPSGSWPPYGWPAPWAGQPWIPWQSDTAAAADGSTAKGTRGEQAGGRQALSSSAKRGARGDASAARSHAHLHPQSHPFAGRAPGTDSGGGTASTAPRAFSSADAEGQGTVVAALRLRGLPFSVTVQDVLAFFAQHDVADRIADGPQAAQLLPKANGRPSGQAVVQMRSRFDAEVAQRALYNQWIGGRYIEVFVYGDENDLQGSMAGGSAGESKDAVTSAPGPGGAGAEWHPGLGSPPWALPPWAGVAPPPVPAGAVGTLGGQDGEPRDGDAWGQMFNWLWREQMPDVSAVAAATSALGPGSAGACAAPAPVDAPARATLQV